MECGRTLCPRPANIFFNKAISLCLGTSVMLVVCIAAVTSFDQWFQYGCPDEPLLPFSMFSVYDQSPPLQVL
jgi:hypothetical protein